MSYTAFASGVNEAREVRGFALAGIPVGAAASHLREAAIQELLVSEGPVFLDSGAFSEVSFSPVTGQLEITSPISAREWRRRLAIYRRLAESLGDRLRVVCPDRVGDQAETLRRIRLYRPELQELAQLGAHILIPLQVGSLTHEKFYAEAQSIAGISMVPAFTMKKAATSDEAAARFLRAVRPARIHLLGMGPDNRRAADVLSLIHRASPETEITMDSNRIRAVTGKGRSLTVTEHDMRSAPIENLYNEVESPVLDALNFRMDYTEACGLLGDWATRDMLREIAMESGFTLSEMASFFDDPNDFLQRPRPGSDDSCYWENPFVSMAIDRAWAKYVQQQINGCVRTAAIRQTFQFNAA